MTGGDFILLSIVLSIFLAVVDELSSRSRFKREKRFQYYMEQGHKRCVRQCSDE